MAPITDEEWADLVAHELPKTSDPVIRSYLESRRALIAQGQRHRSDFSFRQALSPIAAQACDIVSKIRHEERISPVASATRTENLASWKIVKRLPKGALLRAHCHALVDLDRLLDDALNTPGMCISLSPSLGNDPTSVNFKREGRPCIRFRGQPDSSQSLWDDNYMPGSFVSLSKAADEYPGEGRLGFLGWIKGKCGISTLRSDLERGYAGSSAVYSDLISGMLYYEPLWRAFLRRLMSGLVGDRVYWLELGLTFPLAFYREGSETPEVDHDYLFGIIEDEEAKYLANGRPLGLWGLRVVWSTKRSLDPRSIIEDADSCISTKLLWPRLVAGYDLAGPENLGRPLADLTPELFWLRKQCVVEGVTLPFFLQAGGSSLAINHHDDDDNNVTIATDDPLSPENNNLFDALLLGARRIGHAFALPRHPRLIEAIKDKRILTELSLPPPDVETEPSVAGTTNNSNTIIANHPLPFLLMQCVPCALCEDDSGRISQRSRDGVDQMTSIFWHALRAWEKDGDGGFDLATLGSLAESSVRWAAFEDEDAETCSTYPDNVNPTKTPRTPNTAM
ncbi:hypothetical protein B0J18DRAFT_463933 [Chaetomium sp. MPI-SDFR-AT-0129]|nr:hypothetical protein B0J18DRAFT_463933 [Chaetomium sp. MPI-SDFR-AT-0129]